MKAVPVRVGVLNPLPVTLAHFERALAEGLESLDGVTVVPLDHVQTEMAAGSSSLARMLTGVKYIRSTISNARCRDVDLLINVWPSFGYLESILWGFWRQPLPVLTILHDVQPLRPQFGYWRRALPVIRLLSPRRHRWIMHTESASREAMEIGLRDVIVAPHPILPEARPVDDRPSSVLVFGQYKPARDLELLSQLGPLLREAGFRTRIVGRGWPSTTGWDVDDRFVAEPEVEELLGSAGVLLLPYRRYYQSGVAVRAMESGTPVVGVRTDFLVEFFGEDWPGYLEWDANPEDWLEAVRLAIKEPPEVVLDRARLAERRVSELWGRVLRDLV